MKNILVDLNNYLFEQIERINDDSLNSEELEVIIFRDGNRLNTDISNLMIISRADNAILNQLGLYQYQGELKDTATGIARLSRTLSKRRKGGKD